MHVVLDLQACQSPESSRRGIGRYSLSLAKAIAADSCGHCITVLLNGALGQSIEPLRAEFSDLLSQDKIVVWNGLKRTSLIDPGSELRRRASELLRLQALRRLSPDVVHVASVFEGVADDVVSTIPVGETYAAVATLYDLIPLVHQETYLADPLIKGWYMRRIEQLQGAQHLLGISRFSCEEAQQLLSIDPRRVTDISGAADAKFAMAENPEIFRMSVMGRYGICKPFIMYAGGFDSRKNIGALIRAFSLLPAGLRINYQLVIVGRAPGPEKEQLERAAEQVGLNPQDLRFVGFVPDEDLVKFYNLCEIYVFPSLQEGFGLPALEAMSSGAVVIGSRTSSLPEVIGLDEALFDPADDADVSTKLAMGLTNIGFRARFRQHALEQVSRFSWSESARRALKAMEAALASQKGTPNSPPVRSETLGRVALLPAPGSSLVRTGAEVFGDDNADGAACLGTLAEFEGRREEFQRIVVEVVDEAYCALPLDLSLSLPTDIVLNSTEIGGVWSALASRNRPAVVEALYRHGGYRLLRVALDAQFDPAQMATILPPSALGLLARNQVVLETGSSREVVRFERAWRDSVDSFLDQLFDGVAQEGAEVDINWSVVARSLAQSGPAAGRLKNWFVDISNLAIRDAGTGIQRVVRHLLDELMENPPKGFRVEPVILGDDGVVRYARSYCASRYFQSEILPSDEPVEFASGDVYLGLDLAAHLIPEHIATFNELRNHGVLQYFVVYDLLPLLRPDCFEPHLLPLFRSWYEAIAQVADGALCISRAVADEFESWLHQARPTRHRGLSIGWFHLGADLAVPPSGGIDNRPEPHQGNERGLALPKSPTFLMVGTIEPRKGHAQTLAAFELLWSRGVEVNLLLVGRAGWLVGDLTEKLRDHPMLGTRLFWFDNASDDLLLEAYEKCSALLMASEGEGYGLPLIEAARNALPLIVRDLPVFREVVGDNAHYFSGYESTDIANCVASWLKLNKQGVAPDPAAIKWMSWRQSADQLVEVLTDARWSYRWMPSHRRRFSAFDYRLRTQVGRLVRGRIEATGQSGILLYGPYVEVPAGRYIAEVEVEGAGCGQLDVCSGSGGNIHSLTAFEVNALDGQRRTRIRTNFALTSQVNDLEVRISISENASLSLISIEFWPDEDECESPQDVICRAEKV